MYDRDANELEEYDMNKAYLYGSNCNNYCERYYLGVCRAGSIERAIYTVPGDVMLGEGMHLIETLDDWDSEAPAKKSSMAMDGYRLDNLSRTFNARSSAVFNPRASILSTVVEDSLLAIPQNPMFPTEDGCEESIEHKDSEESVNIPFVTLAATRCEYLVEVIDLPAELAPTQTAPDIKLAAPSEKTVQALGKSGVIFDDSWVFDDSLANTARLTEGDSQVSMTWVPETSQENARDEENIEEEAEFGEPVIDATYENSIMISNSSEVVQNMKSTVSADSGRNSLLSRQYKNHFTPSLLLSRAAHQIVSDGTLMELAPVKPVRTVHQYVWQKPVSNWLAADNELFLPHNVMFLANKIPPVEMGRKSSFDRNISRVTHRSAKVSNGRMSTEFVFTVRTLLHHVNIVTGSLVFVKEPAMMKKAGLLSRMSAASALSALIDLNANDVSDADKHVVEEFASSVVVDPQDAQRAAMYGDVRYSSEVTTVVETPSVASVVNAMSTLASQRNSSKETATASNKIEQVSEVVGALDQLHRAVFYFNKRLYLVPMKDVEFMCVQDDENDSTEDKICDL